MDNKFKFCINLVRCIPILSTFCIIISLIFALFEINIVKIFYPFSSSIITGILLYSLSKIFKFCLWHRVLIINLLLVASFTWINTLFKLTSNLMTIRMMLLITSLSSILALIIFIKNGSIRKTSC